MKNYKVMLKLFLAVGLIFFVWRFFNPSLTKRLISPGHTTREAAIEELKASSPRVKIKIAREMVHVLKHPPSSPFNWWFYSDGPYERALVFFVADAVSGVGKPGVPILIEALREGDSRISASMLLGLAKIGPEASEAIPDLMEIYKNPGKGGAPIDVHLAALTALGKVGRGNPQVNTFLLETLKNRDYGAWYVVSRYAVESDTSIIKPMFQVMTAEIAGSPNISVGSYLCFEKNVKTFLPQLVDALHSKSPRVREWGCDVLNSDKSAAIEALPKLRKLIFDENSRVRSSARSILFNLGPDAVSAVPDIVRVLRYSTDKNERAGAAGILARIGLEAKSAVPALEAALTDPEQYVRSSAAAALLKFGVPPERVISIIVVSLFATDYKDVEEYLNATKAIAEIGPKAAETIPYHIEHLASGFRDYIRRGAMDALAGIGPTAKEAIPLILKEANGADVEMRNTAIRALLAIDEGSAEVLQLIGQSMQKPHSRERGTVIHGIVEFSRHAPKAPTEIFKILSNRHLFLNDWEMGILIDAIGEGGANSQELVPALKRMLNADGSAAAKRNIVATLRKIGTPEAIEAANSQDAKEHKW